MEALRALGLVKGRLPAGIHTEVEDGVLLLFARLDMLHLDADALADRLAHWSARELARRSPRAMATLSFRHAVPAEPHEASTLDLQEGWLGLEATLGLELERATDEDVLALAELAPRLQRLIEEKGRPAGHRSPDVGSVE